MNLMRNRPSSHLFILLILFVLNALGYLAIYRAGVLRGYAPSFRAWGFPAVPIVFAIVCLAIVLNQVAGDPRESLSGLALVVAGLPVYYVWSRAHARD